MTQLIRLEWKKNKIEIYLGMAIGIAVLLAVFLCGLAFGGIANDPDGTLDAAPGGNVISAPLELFTGMVYLVFTSVMLATYIVSAYKNRTMNLMFSYPIKRKKILASQMMAVFIFNFLALVITKVFLYGVIALFAANRQSAFLIDFNLGSPGFYLQLLAKSFVLVSMSFIALFVGLAMKSSKAAIVTSFLLIIVTQANVADISLANNMAVPIVLTGISFLFAALSIKNVETKDVM